MKQKLGLSCLLLISIVQLNAQKTQSGEWHFGIKGDINFSKISGNGMGSSFVTGAQGGGYAEYVFNSDWSLQPELLFTQNNTKRADNFLTYYNTDGNVFAAQDIKLGYISVPVMLKYNFNKHLSFLIGPQYSQLLIDAESLSDKGENKAFKKSEFSANAGMQFNLGTVALYGRYNQGISNINDIDTRYAWRSGHIQIGIAIKLK